VNLKKFLVATVMIASSFCLFTSSVSAQWTIPSPNVAITQNESVSTYENSDSSIKVDYPADWYYIENSVSDVEFYPSAPTSGASAATATTQPAEKSNATVKLTVTPLQSNLVPINSIVDATLKDKSKNLENFLLLDSALIPNSKDTSTHKLIYSYIGPDSSKIVQLDYGTISNNKLYLLSYIADTKQFYDYIQVADKMMGSLSQYSKQAALQKYIPQLLNPVSEMIEPLGDPNATITLVEFADYRCPFCEKFHKESFDKIVTNYIDTGKVKYLFKDFVVNDRGEYKGSAQASVATYCAAEQDKYWEFSKEIYKNFKPEPQHWITLESLTQFANNVQIVDVEKFKSCVESNKYQDLVQQNKLLATSLGLTGTPSFAILKGDKIQSIVPGAIPYEVFDSTFTALQASS
jgi:protein-disulfide isomerase